MSTLDERLARVRALAEKPEAEFDHKKPGEKVVGEVIGMSEASSDFGPYPVVTIDEGKRLVRVACARSGLRNKLGDVRPGDAVSITYLGLKPMANGKEFNAYRVHVEPAEPVDELPRVPTFEAPSDYEESF